ncbi:unnamed protein product [Prunus armeniaca]|uniref:Peptidase S9 prolyl oligopeptidase catalytic domain-containing protein n=1 Tax=Prunus armeniaca TaxID=36596 RepID=A0A6J5Y3D5_PRUAR|nr:unnamed protein product [Prunus armeniaca]
MPEKNVVSFTTMIDGYAKYGDMASARFLFDQAPNKDIVAWSALISGYAQNGQPNEAVKIFLEMSTRNVKPDEFIMVSLMSACSQVGCLQVAKWVDSYVSQSSIDVHQDHVHAALIDMNAKCGNMERATSLFDKMPKRDMISYCSMIQGLSVHGRGDQAVALFNKMLNEGLAPDEVAFTVILTACSRSGLIEEGWHFFESMRHKYHLTPSPDHYACMVDLLSRLGRLNAAYDLLQSMPMEPHAGAWGALLGACKLNGNIELGELVANRLFEIEPLNPGNYVLLSNIYAAADRWFDVSADVNDVLVAMDHVIDLGLASPSKLAVLGGSHGGILKTHDWPGAQDKFVAAAARNPVCNLAIMVGRTDIPDWRYAEAYGSEGQNSFTDAPSAEHLTLFQSKFPIAHVSKVKTPTLLLLGALDLRAPVSTGLQYALALKEKGVPVKVIVFPNDTHAIERPQSDFESFLSIGVWFKKYL